MADLSQVSTADLMKAAGIQQSGNDLSQVSTEDLMKAAGINSPASTGGYVGTRALGGFLEGGKNLATAANLEMGQFPEAEETAQLPSGQETANKMVYGTPNVPAPNTFARYAGAVGEAVGSNPVLSAIAPGYTTASALGSEGASDLNKATGSNIPDFAARFAGGTLAGGVYGLAKNSALNAAQRLANPSPLSDIESNKDVVRALKQQERFGETLIGQYQEPAQATAEAIGPQASTTQIGQSILDKVQSWLGFQKAAASRNFNAIEAQFPQGHRVDLPSTTELLTKPSEGPPLPSVANQLADQLNKTSTLPYSAVKQWRTEIGGALSNDPKLGPLYDALTKDMEAALQSRGGDEAISAFRQANSGYRNAQEFIDARLGKLGDATLPPEKLSNIVQNPAAHTTELTDLLNAGVISRDDVSAIGRAWLEKSGRNAEGIWDPSALSRNVGKLQLQSPEAVNLLFRSTPEQASQFDALLQRSRALSSTTAPLARANMPRPGLLRRLVPVGAGLGADAAGVPGGEFVAGYLLGHGNGGNVNPLYALPRQYPSLGLLSPFAVGGGRTLLNPPTQANGLLGQ